MVKLLKYQEEYLSELEKASNDELFGMFEITNMPDDWDGDFTKEGEWKLDECRKEMIKRLKSINFLSKEYE